MSRITGCPTGTVCEVTASGAWPLGFGIVVSSVAAVLVSHDGGRWLPAVIDGSACPDAPRSTWSSRVDTGSKDDSAERVASAFGDVIRAPGIHLLPRGRRPRARAPARARRHQRVDLDPARRRQPGAGCADRAAGRGRPRPGGRRSSAPSCASGPRSSGCSSSGSPSPAPGGARPGSSAASTTRASTTTYARCWPSTRPACWCAVPSSRSSAASTPSSRSSATTSTSAGARSAAGHRTIVVPDAVVFHAEAAHRGVRRTPLTGRHTHYQERRAALYTLLANARGRALPWLVVRLTFGTLLRMVGFLVVRVGRRGARRAGRAGVALLLARRDPGGPTAPPRGRRVRRRGRRGPRPRAAGAVVGALPPRPRLPRRPAGGRDQPGAGRRRASPSGGGRADARERAAPGLATTTTCIADDSGIVARFLTNPVALVLAAAGGRGPGRCPRQAWGSIAGGGFRRSRAEPATGGGSRSRPGTRSVSVRRSRLRRTSLPMALLATLLGGSPAAAVSVRLRARRAARAVGCLALPAGGRPPGRRSPGRRAGCCSGARRRGRSCRWPAARGATDGSGRSALSAVLPWLAHAALGLRRPGRRPALAGRLAGRAAARPWPPRSRPWCGSSRWSSAWSWSRPPPSSCAAPSAAARSGDRRRPRWRLVPLLLAPWWVPAIQRGAGRGAAARRRPAAAPGADTLDLVSGRLADLGAPWWIGVVLAVLALLALVPRATRIPVLVCWLAAALAAGTGRRARAPSTFALAATHGRRRSRRAAGGPPGRVRRRRRHRRDRADPGHRAGRGRLAARWSPSCSARSRPSCPSAGWRGGSARDPAIADGIDTDIPVYMVQSSEEGPAHGILVIRGERRGRADLHGPPRRRRHPRRGRDPRPHRRGPRLHPPGARAGLPAHPRGRRRARRSRDRVRRAARRPPTVTSPPCSTPPTGLVQASAEERTTRAWQVDRPLDAAGLEGPVSWLRVVLLVAAGRRGRRGRSCSACRPRGAGGPRHERLHPPRPRAPRPATRSRAASTSRPCSRWCCPLLALAAAAARRVPTTRRRRPTRRPGPR